MTVTYPWSRRVEPSETYPDGRMPLVRVNITFRISAGQARFVAQHLGVTESKAIDLIKAEMESEAKQQLGWRYVTVTKHPSTGKLYLTSTHGDEVNEQGEIRGDPDGVVFHQESLDP